MLYLLQFRKWGFQKLTLLWCDHIVVMWTWTIVETSPAPWNKQTSTINMPCTGLNQRRERFELNNKTFYRFKSVDSTSWKYWTCWNLWWEHVQMHQVMLFVTVATYFEVINKDSVCFSLLNITEVLKWGNWNRNELKLKGRVVSEEEQVITFCLVSFNRVSFELRFSLKQV